MSVSCPLWPLAAVSRRAWRRCWRPPVGICSSWRSPTAPTFSLTAPSGWPAATAAPFRLSPTGQTELRCNRNDCHGPYHWVVLFNTPKVDSVDIIPQAAPVIHEQFSQRTELIVYRWTYLNISVFVYCCWLWPLSVIQECYRPCWTGGDLGFGGRVQRYNLPAGGAIAPMVRDKRLFCFCVLR